MKMFAPVFVVAASLLLVSCSPAAETEKSSSPAPSKAAEETKTQEEICAEVNTTISELGEKNPAGTDIWPLFKETHQRLLDSSTGELKAVLAKMVEENENRPSGTTLLMSEDLMEVCKYDDFYKARYSIADRPGPVLNADFQLREREGYEMSYHITLHEVQTTPGKDLDALTDSECLKRLNIKDPEAYTFKTMQMSVDRTRPEVNGFQWPEGAVPGVSLSGGYNCGAGITESDYPQATNETGVTVAVFKERKTPNNPEGEFTLPKITVSSGGGLGSRVEECTVLGAEDGSSRTDTCEIAHPGS